jgi:hypothetical protein
MLRSIRAEATAMGTGVPPATGRSLEEILGPNLERDGLSFKPTRGPTTVYHPLPPKPVLTH